MLPTVRLNRLETGDQGTFGRIRAPGDLILFTGEQPWRDNASGVSCVPDGDYRVDWTWSPRFKRMMYLLRGTDPRTGIRAHAANFMGDTAKGYVSQLLGCIALGERLGWMGRQKVILLSAPAVRRFEDRMGRASFILEIRDA